MEKDIFEIVEPVKAEEPQESEVIELDFNLETGETWETVEPNIRVKKVNGKVVRYEVKIDFGRKEVYSKKKKAWVQRQDKRTKSFKTLEEARKFKTLQEEAKKGTIQITDESKQLKKKKHRFIDVADAFYETRKKLNSEGKISDSYLQQYRIQTDHFRAYFNGENNTYIEDFDAQTIEDYFDFKETQKKNLGRNTLIKHRTHLNQIWSYIVKNRKIYGIAYNVVTDAQITALETKHEAIALDYKRLNELIIEACKMEDPTFLYLVVFSMTQGMRRGELCGLKWKDIDWKKRQIIIVHNRVQLGTNEVKKLPKNNKPRMIELHKAGYDTLTLYKAWQEKILGKPVEEDDFVLQWEINLVQGYTCDCGKVSRKWKEIYEKINKYRVKAKKEAIPYGRLHDGKHTYITLGEHGYKKDDGTIICAPNYVQLYESAGHELPKLLQNTSTQVYSKDVGARWEVTEFWNQVVEVDIESLWETMNQVHQIEYEMMTQKEKDLKAERKAKRYEKAKRERLAANPPEEILIEYK